MAANFQWAVTFVLMNIFSISLLHYVCVENGKIVEEVFSFWLKMVPLGQEGGWKWFFGHYFESRVKSPNWRPY
jgi:hypothetical protein